MQVKIALFVATIFCMLLLAYIGFEIYNDAALYGVNLAMGIITALLAVLLYLLVLLSRVFKNTLLLVFIQLLPLIIAMVSVYVTMKLTLKIKQLEDAMIHFEKRVEGIY